MNIRDVLSILTDKGKQIVKTYIPKFKIEGTFVVDFSGKSCVKYDDPKNI